jgi:hypothetical protein
MMMLKSSVTWATVLLAQHRVLRMFNCQGAAHATPHHHTVTHQAVDLESMHIQLLANGTPCSRTTCGYCLYNHVTRSPARLVMVANLGQVKCMHASS